jgi:cysteine desulfuration protein SufE
MTTAYWLKKQEEVKNLFSGCLTVEAKYQKIIELGRAQPPLPQEFKTLQNSVKGCQSLLYLYTHFEKGVLFFQAESEALISAGLATLLIRAYNGEPPETVLTCTPSFIHELDLPASLSPGRSNGLSSLYLHMQRDALKFIVNKDCL